MPCLIIVLVLFILAGLLAPSMEEAQRDFERDIEVCAKRLTN